MKKNWLKFTLGALLLSGCGSSSNQTSLPAGGNIPAAGSPPALPAKISSVSDPELGDNDDVSSPQDSTFRVDLKPGWNALAFQVDFVTQIVAGPEVVGFTTYENGEYLPPEPLTTGTVNRGEGTSLGFFVYCTAPTTVIYRGTPHRGLELAGLEPGWNLVAPPLQHLDDLAGSVQVLEVDGTAEAHSSDGEADVSLPLWVYSPLALAWRKPHQAGTLAREIIDTNHAPPLSNKDYPDSKYVCDEELSESEIVPPLAFYQNYRWTPGMTLNVLFLDGDDVPEEVYARAVELVRDAWEANCSLKFRFFYGEPDPNITYHIRATFLVDKGYNSYIGTASQSQNPSMNLSRLHKKPLDGPEFRRVVVHEFGHALGTMHEHQNPNVNINWDHEAVYADMARSPNFWDRDRTAYNYFRTNTSDLASPFDSKSVMLYSIKASWTTDGFSVPYLPDASVLDKEWIRRAYP